jgi:predicted permease
VVGAESLRRVYVEMTFPNGNTHTRGPMSYPEFMALRDRVSAFDRVAAYQYPQKVPLGRGVDAPRVKRSLVTADFFRVLGVRPAAGRFFVADDDRETESRPAAVLGYAFWQRQYDGDPTAVGHSLVLDGREYAIVGVAPEGFSGMDVDAADVWAPMAPVLVVEDGPKWSRMTNSFGFHIVAHLRPGATAAQAAQEATADVRPAYEGSFLAERPARVHLGSVIPGRRLDRRDPGISVATRLAGAAVIVLIIACANVANLLLARALSRRRELAVRMALGVGRGRLISQLLTESVLLAMLAGGAAIVVAYWGGSLLRALVMPEVTWVTPPVDGRVLALTAVVALAVGVAAGLLPAVQMTRPDLTGSLKAGWRDRAGSRSFARSGLLLIQAAFSVLLLVGAGLFVRSLHNARTMDVGFALDRTILVDVRHEGAPPPIAETDERYRVLAERARSVPGVARTSVAAALPFWTMSFQTIRVPGWDSLPNELKAPLITRADGEFMSTMGVRVVAGRPLSAEDHAGAPRVAVVNATMARLLWPGRSALGRCFRIAADSAPCTEVVGVVRDVQLSSLREEPLAQFYVPLAQNPEGRRAGPRYLVLRAADDAGDIGEVALRVRASLRGAYDDLEALSVRPMTELVDPELRPFRLGATMFGTFGILALALAGIGLYAVISFGVARRTRELGIRAALGAQRSDVARLVLGEGVRVTTVGVLLGIALALALGRVVESLLFDASPRDPVVLGVVATTLLLVAVAASLIPAWRAGRVDPVIALREE